MSRKQLIWMFTIITLILALVVLYQQIQIQSTTGTSSNIKSVRKQTMNQQSGTDQEDLSENNTSLTGTTTGSIDTGAIQIVDSNTNSCVTSYQALIDRVQGLGETSISDLPQALADIVGLGYCNGSTPKESDFLTITSNNQTFSYDRSISGGALKIDSSTIIPDFIKTCGDTCPVVQAIRTVRSDNKYVVLETTQSRSYQSSFKLISTTNGTTMLFWSSLSFVDPVVSYAWSKDGHFAFIASIGRSTDTYIVQPKGFPKTTPIPDEIDTPVALSIAGDMLVVMYDRNPSNTDLSDRYTKTYNINELSLTTVGSSNIQ